MMEVGHPLRNGRKNVDPFYRGFRNKSLMLKNPLGEAASRYGAEPS